MSLDKNIEKTAQDDTDPFYKCSDNKSKYFIIPNFERDQWQCTVKGNLTYVSPKARQDQVSSQGWKLHITANVEDAQKLLYVVSAFLLSQHISFSFINNRDGFIELNSKYADRVNSGKFITVYSKSVEQFLSLLDQLKLLTDEYKEGPYILSDKQWKESHVFFQYGSFDDIRLVAQNKDFFLYTPEGMKIIDKQRPYYNLPDFVDEPKKIRKENMVPDSRIFSELRRYDIQGAISFSNAGGVYLASRKSKSYVLKEGRSFAGLDSKLNDSFARIKHEYEVLLQLNNVEGIVKAKSYFTVWKDNYLLEEKVQGLPLTNFLSLKYPFMVQDHRKEINHYFTLVQFIIRKMIVIVSQMHKKGIALGGIHLENVLFQETTRKVTIVDFETAASPKDDYKPLLLPSVLIESMARSFGEADWFSIRRLAHFLLLPSSVSERLAPGLFESQQERIIDTFGPKAKNFFKILDHLVHKHTFSKVIPFLKEPLSKLPDPLTLKTREYVIKGLRAGIISNLDFRTERLIKGEVVGVDDEISRLAVVKGAFGGILSLLRSGGIDSRSTKKIQCWLKEIKPRLSKMITEPKDVNWGLFTGLSGICSILSDLGEHRYAVDLLKRMPTEVKTKDYSLYSGIAGKGLACLAFYTCSNDLGLLHMALGFADKIKAAFLSHLDEGAHKLSNPKSLLMGTAGEALFLSQISLITGVASYTQIAKQMIQEIIDEQLLKTPDGELQLLDDDPRKRRLLPYLNNGSVGIALIMLELNKHDSQYLDNNKNKVLKQLIHSNYSSCSIMGGLFNGYAGLTVLGTAIDSIYGNDELLQYNLTGLNSFLVSRTNKEVLMPSGKPGVRCSMNIDSGSAGVLLVLADIKSGNWGSWLPLPQENALDIFSKVN